MSINTTSIYLLRCVTNLHAGSGDENYGVIDNRVQRDVSTGYPTIFSSSLKGAFREFFECTDPYKPKNGNKATHPFVKNIFGSSAGDDDNMQQGSFRFLPARLISVPLKSNSRPFYNCISPSLVKEFLDFISVVRLTIDPLHKAVLEKFTQTIAKPIVLDAITAGSKVFIEDVEAESKPDFLSSDEIKIIQRYTGENPALLPDELVNIYTSDLPVIARNNLEDGQSKNLWYEEIVPRETRFWFGIIHSKEDRNLKEFEDTVFNNTIQVGANATIGYGVTHIFKP